MPADNDDFRSLMQRVCDGSEEAAWELVERHGEAIRRAVRRALNRRLRAKFDSLDFVQLVWSSFFRSRDRAKQFTEPGQLVAFLVKMSRNKVGMEARRRFKTEKFDVSRELPLDGIDESHSADLPGRQSPPIAAAIAHERWDRLTRDQPLHYRRIIRMKLEGYTCRDIADCLHLAESTVRRFLNRLLKETLEEETRST